MGSGAGTDEPPDVDRHTVCTHASTGIIPAVKRLKNPEDLSVEELRRLLLEKRRVARSQRLEKFRRTGRAVDLAPDLPPASLQDWHADGMLEEEKPVAPGEQLISKRRLWTDRFLLGVEILAVLGLVALLVIGVSRFMEYNAEFAAALQGDTGEATPLITAVILPSGHTPPNAPGGVRPNEEEIPEHLRPLVQSLANIPVPTTGPQQAVRIQIPGIDVDAPIVQGDGWEQLKKGVGQHVGSADPGENGNLVLSGHNDVYGEAFRYLDQLAAGDPIIIFTQQRQFIYTVTETRIVEPTQVEVMASTGEPTVTLISCYPYLVDKKRIVVFGELQNP